jgi:hypothetical protein
MAAIVDALVGDQRIADRESAGLRSACSAVGIALSRARPGALMSSRE